MCDGAEGELREISAPRRQQIAPPPSPPCRMPNPYDVLAASTVQTGECTYLTYVAYLRQNISHDPLDLW